MRRFIAYGFAIVLLAACSTQEIDIQTLDQDHVVFYASFEQPSEEDTRVYVNENLLLRWTADDRVSIFNKITYNQQYRFIGETGDYEGGFSKVDNPEFVTGDEIPHVVSVYPFQRQTRITEDEIITLNLPSEQFYAQNSFGLGANTMVSVSSGNLLKYRNVGGYLVFSLYGAGVSVSSITLKGNNGEKIAGKATVSMPVNGHPSASMANDAATEITLTCETPVRLGASAETPTRFWFVVPPVTFSKGFTITVCNSAGDTFEKSTSKSVTIERNNLAKMSPIKVDLPISNNVICYTSTDGEAVVPNNPDAFGAAIVSNEYENGQGIIQFDGDVTVIGYNAFRSSRLSSITIPDSVTSIGDHAFSFCYDLASMTLPDSVTSIGEYAFLWCRSLSSITIPESVAVIKRYAFASCEGLSSLTIPGSVVSIGDVAFAWCKQISELTISEGVTSIGDYAFQECTSLSGVTIPDSVTSIGAGAFCLCSSLMSFNGKFASSDGLFLIDSGNLIQAANGAMVGHIDIPEGVTSIGDDAFNLCTGLTSIIIPESVEGIGDFAFQECTGLTSVIIPGSVANIGSSSFADCIHMSEVTISEGVKSISKGAFAGCVGLQTITVLPKVPPTGGNGMFINTGSCPIYVRCGSLDAYKAANYWSEYADRIRAMAPLPEAVDLGLPSGVKWASLNVGASKPEEYGDYFAWGETEPKSEYSWETHKWCNGSPTSLTKYNTKNWYGTVDYKVFLDLSDDAANANWGGQWRMPTNKEMTELRDKCTWTWTTQNGNNGYRVTGPNGNSIFLPAAGSDYSMGNGGDYWTSLVEGGLPVTAYCMSFDSSNLRGFNTSRFHGFSVRPVLSSSGPIRVNSVSLNKTSLGLYVGGSITLVATVQPANAECPYVFWSSSNESVATVSSDGVITAVGAGTVTITATTTDGGKTATCTVTVTEPYMAIDLGLSVKWASFNVGATKPEEYGDYYAWGETQPYYSSQDPLIWKEGKSAGYDWDSYRWCKGSDWCALTRYCPSDNTSRWRGSGGPDGKTEFKDYNYVDDAARANWGGKWRTPTYAEWTELRQSCTWTWTKQNGVKGYRVTSNKTGFTDKSIFLPVAGCWSGTPLYDVGSDGFYWSSSLYTGEPSAALCMHLTSGGVGVIPGSRCVGFPVRPVYAE